ncbi:hypothetical protein [Shewanella algae]|uniref:hypothetical protein n=1 Tax=Shewanella algae TaxID=38313 RepID=UPI003999D3B4
MKSSIPSLTAVALSVAMVFGAAATQAAQSQSAAEPHDLSPEFKTMTLMRFPIH